MKIFKYLVAVFILLSTYVYSQEGYVNYTPKLRVVDTGYESSWWERTQYYNGVPKYSGAFGTYTHKHSPLAVAYKNDIYHVFTNNSEDGNFYVYVAKNLNERVVIHTIENWNDPHTNAVISVDKYGYIEVHIASRGLNHKFQSGKIYRSLKPESLDFYCVSGCTSVNIEAYPQLHQWTPWGEYKLYTYYEYEPETSIKNKRRPWAVNKYGFRYKLSTESHYQVSHYAKFPEQLCTAMNTLKEGNPDYRVHLSVMCTEDGQNWTDLSGNCLNIPVTGEHLVYSTAQEQGHTFVYLKDIYYYKGKWRVLFTESETDDPTKGSRWLKEFVQGEGVKTITEVGHNYSAGSYVVVDHKLYIVVGKSNTKHYLSGSLYLYNDCYELLDTLIGEYSYVRRVKDKDGVLVASEGDSANPLDKGKHLFIYAR